MRPIPTACRLDGKPIESSKCRRSATSSTSPAVGMLFLGMRGRRSAAGRRAGRLGARGDRRHAGHVRHRQADRACSRRASARAAPSTSKSPGPTSRRSSAWRASETMGASADRRSGRAVPFPKPSADLSAPELHIVPRWDQAADLGVTAAELGYAVNALVDGAYAGDYNLGGDKIDLSIVGNDDRAKTAQDVRGLSILHARRASRHAGIGRRRRSPRAGPSRSIAANGCGRSPSQVTPPPEMPIEEAMVNIQEQDRRADRSRSDATRASIKSTSPARPTSCNRPGCRSAGTCCWPSSSPIW